MKKITRNIEMVEYSVTMFDHESEQLSKSTYTDFESLKESDIIRALNSALSAKGDTRRVIKIKPVNASSGAYEMPLDVFIKYAHKVEKPGV